MHAEAAHAGLRALEALLNFEGEQASFAQLCQRLQQVFGQDHAVVLAEDADALVCIAAAPSGAIGARWPREAFFTDVLRGGVRAMSGTRGSDAGQSFAPDLIPAGASALCLPIGVRGRRALLLLRREAGKAEFDEGDIAFARQCAVVALAAIAARHGNVLAAEAARWRRQVEDGQRHAHEAEQDCTFLKDIVDALSIGLTVQDEGGRFILVNKAAAANLETPAQALIGASPADFLPAEEAAQRRQWEIELIRSGDNGHRRGKRRECSRRTHLADFAHAGDDRRPAAAHFGRARHQLTQANRAKIGAARLFRRPHRPA